jgi:Protein of unknown function (DUF3593)
MVFGFYFLLVFVIATIPAGVPSSVVRTVTDAVLCLCSSGTHCVWRLAGIYAKTVYKTSLANVDWLHGVSEALLTCTNLFIGVAQTE